MTDWEFVFDGVVGFLTSPVWNIPIVSFIEKHCIVFDTSEENTLILTEIHKEYTSLVEELLTSYLKDVGITEEQFVRACEAGSTGPDQSKVADRSIFKQVWAGEDFELFKSIMVKKNLDLELQALRMIQQRNGVVPKVFESELADIRPRNSKSGHRNDEELLLKEVMKLSEQEYEREKERRKEIEKMEKTLALSSREESERLYQMAEDELENMERMVLLTLEHETNGTTEKSSEKSPHVESPKNRSATSPKTIQSSNKSETKTSPKTTEETCTALPPKAQIFPSEQPESVQSVAGATKRKSETPIKTVPAYAPTPSKPMPKPSRQTTTPMSLQALVETPADAAKNWLSSAMAEAKTPSGNISSTAQSENKRAMEAQIEQRAQYMRMQREKLLNLKKQERTKHLNSFEKDAPKRPMSSRVARRVTAGSEAEKAATNEIDEQQQKKLELRKALAARLKKEVVNAE